MSRGTTEMTESLPVKSDACLTTGPNGMVFILNVIYHNDCTTLRFHIFAKKFHVLIFYSFIHIVINFVIWIVLRH